MGLFRKNQCFWREKTFGLNNILIRKISRKFQENFKKSPQNFQSTRSPRLLNRFRWNLNQSKIRVSTLSFKIFTISTLVTSGQKLLNYNHTHSACVELNCVSTCMHILQSADALATFSHGNFIVWDHTGSPAAAQ